MQENFEACETLRLMIVRDEASDVPDLESDSPDEETVVKWIECAEIEPGAEETEAEGTECVEYGFKIHHALPFKHADLRSVRVGVSREGEILEVVLRGATRSG